MDIENSQRVSSILDREEIHDLVRRERFARDQRHFDVMRSCFHDDARIRSSWFKGNADEYVTSTREFMKRVGNGKHWVFPAFVNLSGDRATVESPAMIFNRTDIDGVEVDFNVFCRFHSRVVRVGGAWKLMSFDVIFERDALGIVDPAASLTLDAKALASYRPSYKFLSHIQALRGITVDPDLYGDDRPEDLARFHEAANEWLGGGA